MPVSAAFWIFLLIVMVIAFFMLLPRLGVGNREQITDNREQRTEKREEGTGNREQGTEKREQGTGNREQGTEGKKPQTEKPAAPEQKEPEKKPQTEKPAAPVSTTPAQTFPTADKPVEMRNRSIYLIQEANMAQVKINRSLKVSDTPLKDSINALLAGPTADERKRGIISLVPAGSKLLSVKVNGSTAYLNFNEEFQYNTRGREGCAAQIRQIVWTATEFTNIQNVQFLIEGEIVDSLPEGIMINSPISR